MRIVGREEFPAAKLDLALPANKHAFVSDVEASLAAHRNIGQFQRVEDGKALPYGPGNDIAN